MKKEIYLDNAATTPVNKEVLKTMEPFSNTIYGNPSSFNDAGRQARKALDQSRRVIAHFLGAQDQEVVFTGSGTEANNLAILGLIKSIQGLVAFNRKNPHIITTRIEHPSVLRPIQYLEKQGLAKVTYLSVDRNGLINLEDFKKVLRPKTVLVSIIYVNNEIGVVQQIKKISKILKDFRSSLEIGNWKLEIHGKAPLFHVDACQATGYLDMNVNNLGVDLMTVNSSKIHGPKGTGALYVRQGTPIFPLIFGGGQEGGLRPGTENVVGIAGFAEAITQLTVNKGFEIKTQNLKKYFAEGVKKKLPGVVFNGGLDQTAPHILSFIIPDIEAEAVLLMLDKYGIRASAGAACSAYDMEISYVLTAIGLSKNDARATLRFSLGRQNTKNEIDYVLKILPRVVKEFHRLYPKRLKSNYYIKIKPKI